MDIRRLVTCLLIVACAIPLMGMGRMNVNRSDDPRYSYIIGKQLKTKEDLVVYHADGVKRPGVAAYGDYVPERDEMKNKFPFRYYDVKVLGILPKGSILKIVRVTQEGSPTANFIFYYAEITSSENVSFTRKIVGLRGVCKPTNPPQIKPELVEWLKP